MAPAVATHPGGRLVDRELNKLFAEAAQSPEHHCGEDLHLVLPAG